MMLICKQRKPVYNVVQSWNESPELPDFFIFPSNFRAKIKKNKHKKYLCTLAAKREMNQAFCMIKHSDV
jgi:hypothetical protein